MLNKFCTIHFCVAPSDDVVPGGRMEEEEGVFGAGGFVQPFLEDTLHCCSIQSSVPEIARHQECCMGIDEAGRGPVLGKAQQRIIH